MDKDEFLSEVRENGFLAAAEGYRLVVRDSLPKTSMRNIERNLNKETPVADPETGQEFLLSISNLRSDAFYYHFWGRPETAEKLLMLAQGICQDALDYAVKEQHNVLSDSLMGYARRQISEIIAKRNDYAFRDGEVVRLAIPEEIRPPAEPRPETAKAEVVSLPPQPLVATTGRQSLQRPQQLPLLFRHVTDYRF